MPELQDYLERQGRKYSKAVLYENVVSLKGRLLEEDEPKEIGGRLTRAYHLNEAGIAWTWWLSLPNTEKVSTMKTYSPKGERRRLPYAQDEQNEEMRRVLPLVISRTRGSPEVAKELTKLMEEIDRERKRLRAKNVG